MSSPMISSTFGAPSGALSGSGKSAFESLKATSILPRNGGSGGGSTVRSGWSGETGVLTTTAPFQARGANRPFDTTSTGQPKATGRPSRLSGPGDPISSPQDLRLRSPPRGLSAKGSLRPVLPGCCPSSPPCGFHRCRPIHEVTIPREPVSPPRPKRVMFSRPAEPADGSAARHEHQPWAPAQQTWSSPGLVDTKAPRRGTLSRCLETVCESTSQNQPLAQRFCDGSFIVICSTTGAAVGNPSWGPASRSGLGCSSVASLSKGPKATCPNSPVPTPAW